MLQLVLNWSRKSHAQSDRQVFVQVKGAAGLSDWLIFNPLPATAIIYVYFIVIVFYKKMIFLKHITANLL